MYQEFFRLKCAPFDLAPDPRFLCLTEQHARAVANVRFALMNHDSFVVITGEIGTGKTTVLNAALGQLGAQYVVARESHTTLTDIELLQSLLSEFGIPDYGSKKVKLLDKLRDYFLEQHNAGRHVVIIVDEAQHLSSAAIEELRLLSCIDTRDRRIVSIALTGQPSLDEVLDEESLAPLRQRTRLRQRLRPLDEAGTAEYIRYRLKVAGGDADAIFARETLPEIHRLTLGIPRLINTLCDSAMMVCRVDARQQVDLETLINVVKDLGWRWSEAAENRSHETHEAVAPALETTRSASGDEDRAWVRAYLAGKLVSKSEIRAFPFTVGRAPGNSLVIEEQTISRRHALINRVGESYVVEDLHSSNGILVNKKACDTAVLASGDVITIGLANLVFSLNDEQHEYRHDDDEDTGRNLAGVTQTQPIPEDSEVIKISARLKARQQ